MLSSRAEAVTTPSDSDPPSSRGPRRKEPLPDARIKSAVDNGDAPQRVAELLESIAYRRADEDPDLLQHDRLRHVRLQLEYLKAELAFQDHGVRSTIVLFGGLSDASLTNATWQYDGAEWLRTCGQGTACTAPPARIGPATGYDPEAAVTLWQKMGDVSDERPAEFLSTHPAPENRQAALNTMIPRMLEINPDRTRAPIHPVTIVQ